MAGFFNVTSQKYNHYINCCITQVCRSHTYTEIVAGLVSRTCLLHGIMNKPSSAYLFHSLLLVHHHGSLGIRDPLMKLISPILYSLMSAGKVIKLFTLWNEKHPAGLLNA